jgi:hypothetical protein
VQAVPHLGKGALNSKEETILLILQPVYVMGSVWLVHLAGKQLATECYKCYVALKMKEREMGRSCCILGNDEKLENLLCTIKGRSFDKRKCRLRNIVR